MSWEMGWPLGLEGPLHHPAQHRPAASYGAAEKLEDEGGELQKAGNTEGSSESPQREVET